MPQAIPMIAYGIASYAGASGLVASAIAFAASVAVSSYEQNRAKQKARDQYNASLQDRLVMQAMVDAPRSRVYGRARNVDGVTFKGTYGDSARFYDLVVAIAGHEIDAIETIYLNDEAVTLGDDGYVLDTRWCGKQVSTGWARFAATSGVMSHAVGAVVDGTVNVVGIVNGVETSVPVTVSGGVAHFDGTGLDEVAITYQQAGVSPRVSIGKYLGGPGQDLSGVLKAVFPGLIEDTDRFAGYACLHVRLSYDTDVFPSGPPSVSAVIRGAKVLDPRTGITAWSDNNALCALDWARYAYGGGLQADEIDQASFIAAANACDVVQTFTLRNTDGTTESITRKTYTCGLVCTADRDPEQWLDELVSGMAGEKGWAGGALRVRAGAWRAPVFDITEDWLSDVEPIDIVPEPSADEAVNVVRYTIANELSDYVAAPIAPVQADAYITADGRELPLETSLEAVTHPVQAQHVGGVRMREQRSGLTVSLPCNLRAFPLQLFDVGTLTLQRFGWAGKQVEVRDKKFSLDGGVVLLLKETAASLYTADAEFSSTDETPNTALPDPFEVPVLDFALSSGTAELLKQADGTIVPRIRVEWGDVADEAVRNGGTVEIRFGRATADPQTWQSVVAPGAQQREYLIGVQEGAYYCVTVRAANRLVRGEWAPAQLVYVVGEREAPANVTGLAATIVQGGVLLRWNANAEVDYKQTRLHLGADFNTFSTEYIEAGSSRLIPWMPLGTYTIWAKHEDRSGNFSASAASVTFTVDASALIQWAGISGRPMTLRAGSRGFSDSYGVVQGLINAETGATLGDGVRTHGGVRSYSFSRIDLSARVVTFTQHYDVFTEGTDSGNPLGYGRGSAALAADLNATPAGTLVVVTTADEPMSNRLNNGLPAAMYRCGASRTIFGSTASFKSRGAYVLVGIAGCGEGNGQEALGGKVDNDSNAWAEIAFVLQGGTFLVTGVGSTPNTIADYGYTGALDATRNKVWRQASDPGSAAVDGDIWQNTSDGKEYKRIAGAWWPTVGAGSIDTGEMAAGSATRVATVQTFGNLSGSSYLNTISAWNTSYASGYIFPVLEFTITAPVSCELMLTVNGYAYVGLAGSPSTQGEVWIRHSIQDGASFDVNQYVDIRYPSPKGTDHYLQLALSRRFALAAGVPRTFQYYAAYASLADVMQINYPATMRAEVVLR